LGFKGGTKGLPKREGGNKLNPPFLGGWRVWCGSKKGLVN